MEAEDQPQQHHKGSEAIKDLFQQLNEAEYLANHQQNKELQQQESIKAEKQLMLQQLKVTHQKQEEVIQKLQKENMESEKRHSFQEFQEAEQESEQQQRALIASEKLILLQESEQEQQQHAWIRTAETKLLQGATIRLEADSMVQAKQSMCSASTTIRTNDLQSERPATTTPSLSDVELDEAQQDAQELRTHMHVNAADMLSIAGHVVPRDCKRLRVT